VEAVVFAGADGTRFALPVPAGRPVYRLPGGVADPDLAAFLTRFLAAVTAFADTGELRPL
jgi:hypothetical protein